MFTTFHYLYRDAGNFKAYGSITFEGRITEAQKQLVRSRLETGEFFIAEQIGLVPLQPYLQSTFCGGNDDDHCWHTVDEWDVHDDLPADVSSQGSIDAFVSRFSSVTEWQEELSLSH